MTNTGAIGQLMDGIDEPCLARPAWRLGVNHLGVCAPFGHFLANQQRNDRSGKANNQGKDQQHLNIQTLIGDEAIDAQNAERDAQYQHDCKVGQQE